MERWRLNKIICPAQESQPAGALPGQGQRLKKHTLTKTECNAQAAKVKEKEKWNSKGGKPTPSGTSLGGPQLRKIMQPVAWATLWGHSALDGSFQEWKGEELFCCRVAWLSFKFTLQRVPTPACTGYDAQSPPGSPWKKITLHGTGLIQALSAQVWTPKMLHLWPKRVQYAEQEVKAGGQSSPRECGRRINWVQDTHCLNPLGRPSPYSRLDGLQTTEIYFSQCWRLGSPRSKYQQVLCLVRTCYNFTQQTGSWDFSRASFT